jgi:hypothetical protein
MYNYLFLTKRHEMLPSTLEEDSLLASVIVQKAINHGYSSALVQAQEWSNVEALHPATPNRIVVAKRSYYQASIICA